MKASRVMVRGCCAVCAVVLPATLASCGLLPVNRAGSTRMLALPAARSSVLVILADQGIPKAVEIASTLLSDSARVGERVIIIGDHGGMVLSSSTAPESVNVNEAPSRGSY